jgi:FKBP-type peptidyl-prolyl cis-trans isomerase FklB
MNKKIYLFFLVSLLILLSSVSCKKSNNADKKNSKDFDAKVSYLIGREYGKDMKRRNIDIINSAFVTGFKEGLKGIKSKYSTDEERMILEEFQFVMNLKKTQLAEKNKKDGIDFLEKNKKLSGIITLPSGLQYKVITEGNGAIPKAKDSVRVNYIGKLIDGTEFDNSNSRKEPTILNVSGVIKGWQEALQLMKVGSKWEICIPSELGYGEQSQNVIPANSVLIFELELLSIEPQKK